MARVYVLGLLMGVFMAAANAETVGIPVEAEDMQNVKGWRVDDLTYFPSQPNIWSRTKLVADPSDTPATATKAIKIPKAGKYNVWVRYESCYGFGSVFSVKVTQGARTVEAGPFGRKDAIKCFPFGRAWTAQGPWYWHNTDYVYEVATVQLAAGPATLVLTKGLNQRPAARRVVDLIYLTDDLTVWSINDWNWRGSRIEPPILPKFTRPYYFKIDYLKGTAPVLPTMSLRAWLIGYYKGPRDNYYASREGFTPQERGKRPPARTRWLKPGDTTGWRRLDFSTIMPLDAYLDKKDADVVLRVSVSYEPDGKGTARTFEWKVRNCSSCAPSASPRTRTTCSRRGGRSSASTS